MKTKLKISKVVLIAITLFIITSISMSNIVVPVQADALASQASSAYLQSSGPYGPQGQPLMDVAAIVMPAVDTRKLLEEDGQRAWDTPPRFATSIDVQINPATDGTWEALENGLLLWRLRIMSPEAISLNMGFTAYHMPHGGQLYLYTPDYGHVVGPFTKQDNDEHGQLWTPIVEGAEVVLEVSLPASEKPQLQLELTSVNHGYVDFETAEKSGSCNVDVICSQGDPWRSQIRSVGRYTFSGSFLCTGALINNTSQNLTPYFLTANHCLSTSPAAASVVVYWNYDCPTCRPINTTENATPISTAGFPTQSGAFLRATYAPSDMTLLELDSAVSASVNAFWSGWDRSGANASSAVAIHHPQGHEKRISFENNATTITSYGGTAVPGNDTHIRITDWDLGTTEGGSSGSPLFDQNLRIIGQLHGGAAACGNNSSDWYGRLFTSWTGGGTNATRLSNWLDPANTSAVMLNGASTTGPSTDIYEPDDSSGQAKVISSGIAQTHNIIPATDVDWVKFTLNASSAVTLETNGAADSDTRMWLYDGNLTQLEFSDDEGTGSYSFIDRTCGVDALPGGIYYVKVDEFGNNAEIPSYQLSLSVTGCVITPTFNDVPSSYWAWDFIERLYDAGVTGGCVLSPLQYCPEGIVTRAQMAVFLERGIHGSSYAPPAVGASTGFVDVPIDYWSGAWIKQLAAEGITAGCGGGNYCPESPVTRAQMAVFLLRAKYGSAYTPPAVGASTGFGDVPIDYWSAAWIKQLVTEGITAGCGSGNYCPETPVTRAQMAVFLVRTFNLP